MRRVEWELGENDLVTLLRPKFANRFYRKYLIPHMKRPYYRIYLDAYGSFVWSHCDGSTTIEAIGEKLQQKFGVEVEPVYDRLALYIRQLKRARFITLPQPTDPQDS